MRRSPREPRRLLVFISFVSLVVHVLAVSNGFHVSTFERKLQSFINTLETPKGSALEERAASAYALFYLYNLSSDPQLREKAHGIFEGISSSLPDAIREIIAGMERWAYDGYPLAKQYFVKAIEEAPSKWWSHMQMMLYYYEIWRRTESAEYENLLLEETNRVLSLNPDVALAYTIEMDVLSRTNGDRVYGIYEDAIAHVSDSPVFWRRSLEVFYGMKDYEKVVECALRLAEHTDLDDKARFMLAYSWWSLGKEDKAYSTLMETNLDALKASWRSTAYVILGEIEERRGHLQKAIEFYSQAIRSNKENFSAFKHLGLAYLKTNLERKDAYARYYLGIAQKLSPNDETVNKVLKELHRRIVFRVVLTIVLPIAAVVVGLLIVVEKLMRPREESR